jgi:hypothetical protein
MDESEAKAPRNDGDGWLLGRMAGSAARGRPAARREC